MQIFEYDLANFPRDDNSVVTVGTFDGLHLGHQDLISRVVKGGSPSVVVTFYPHPQKVVARPGNEVKILTPPEEKVTWMENLNVEIAEMENLTRRLSDTYLDLDLLDQQARSVLGMIRADEIVIR